jgi:hypothetical protein
VILTIVDYRTSNLGAMQNMLNDVPQIFDMLKTLVIPSLLLVIVKIRS